MLVLATDLLNFSLLHILARSNYIDVGWSGDALTCGEEAIAVVGKLDAAEVGLVVGELAKFALEIHLLEIDTSMPYTYERQALGVGIPAERIYVGVEGCADV